MAVAHQQWGAADVDVYRAALDTLRPSKTDIIAAVVAAVVSAVLLIPWWREAPSRSAAIMIGATFALLFLVWDTRRLSLAQQLYLRVRADLGAAETGIYFLRHKGVLNPDVPFLCALMITGCLFAVPWIGWLVAMVTSGFLVLVALTTIGLGFLSPRFRVHFFVHLAAWSRPASRDAFIRRAAANDPAVPAAT